MADLSFPAEFPFNDGTVIEPADVYKMFYSDTAPDEALNIINGRLDEENFASAYKVGPEYTQRKSHVFAKGASGTANLDWKGTRFGMFNTHQPEEGFNPDLNIDPFYPIPGGCRTLYIPWDSMTLALWQIYWTCGSYATDQDQVTRIFLTVDGVYEAAQSRTAGQLGTSATGAPGRFLEFDPHPYEKARYWAGHAFLDIDVPGWHDIGLNVLQDWRVRCGRVHAVSIDVIPWKYGAAL